MLTMLAFTWNTLGSIATQDDLSGAIGRQQAANDQTHQELLEAADQRDAKLDRIDANTRIVPRLRDLLRAECMGAIGLRDVINELKDQYEALVGEEYDEPRCAELVAP